MKNIFLIFFLLIIVGGLKAQYTIPGASQQPAWVFPIWIENGDGQKDTLYLGYDTDASLWGLDASDSIYGVRVFHIDTNRFNATFAIYPGTPGNYVDTAFKVLVTKAVPIPVHSAGIIQFIHAQYPLRVAWDVTLLRHDSLPFPDQNPAPKAQCEMTFNMPVYGDAYFNGNRLFCGFDPLLITDSTQSWVVSCAARDSIYFQDIFNTPGAIPGAILPSIKTWSGELTAIDQIETENVLFEYFPNPGFTYLNLKNNSKLTFNGAVEIINYFGQVVFSKTLLLLFPLETTKIELANCKPGIYLINLVSNENSILLSRKLIIMN